MATQLLCIMLKKNPKKKDFNVIEGDKKGFFYKAKTTTLNSFEGFIKEITYIDKDNISGNVIKKAN